MTELTPSQTVGPFFLDGLFRDEWNLLAESATEGEPIRIEGRLYDGTGSPIDDGMVEIWQADAHGRYRHPADNWEPSFEIGFNGFGRSRTDESGRYWFETIKPGSITADSGGRQAPHLNVHVFARGLLDHLMTRMYFSDEGDNGTDPLLSSVPENRRSTLIAQRSLQRERVVYVFDIVLQGDGETVFFDA